MSEIKAIIEELISINGLLNEITHFLKISALTRSIAGEHILVVFETHQDLIEQA